MALPSDDQPLPDDTATLQAMVHELLDALIAMRRDNTALQARLDQLLRRLYGPKSEKLVDASQPKTPASSDNSLSLDAATSSGAGTRLANNYDCAAGTARSIPQTALGRTLTLHYHLVFSTKNRVPAITPEIEPRLWEYLGGIVRDFGGISIQIGGIEDHVHLLVTLRQDRALMDVVREIKAGSSGWIHETFRDNDDFWWQDGYGAFTVSHSMIDTVKNYIANQKQHHAKRTFEDEFRTLLKKHKVAFKEEYLF